MTGRRTPAAPLRLSTSERLVLGHLRDVMKARTGARLDVPRVAACMCLPLDVTAASIEALLSRRLLRRQPDGRVVVLGVPGSGP